MIETYPSPDALADAAAGAIAAQLDEALRLRARAGLVVTGGRSPGAVYDRLASGGPDWSRVIVTLSDELDVDPMPETQKLAARIEKLEPVAP